MRIGVPKETWPDERRVATTPAAVSAFLKLGFEVIIEASAGLAAGFADADYRDQGAAIAAERAQVFEADIVAQVRTFGANPDAGRADLDLLREGQILIGHGDPLGHPRAAQILAERGVTYFALELVPRITRAQSMDVLSSMATIAGYKAALLAADNLPKMFPMMMTAAGTLRPARAFVIGAGVAGLQAIATCRRLGAAVQAYDVRPAVKEQVESLGAGFVEMDLETDDAQDAGGYAKDQGEDFYRRQRELMARVVADSDVVITTAAIPGKRSPVLVTRDMLTHMRPGSVIVDLAAERGGNCEATVADSVVTVDGVTVLGPTNLPATIPNHASLMYARNVLKFVELLVDDGSLHIDRDDEIIAGTLVSHGGEVVHQRIRDLLELGPLETEGAGE